MRGAYLKSRDECRDNHGGSRGGVGSGYDHGGSQDYELEIGVNQNASAEMLALCSHYDEVMELLEQLPSPLASLLLQSIKAEVKRLKGD